MIDTKNFFAKATFPHGILWRGPWEERDEALKRAHWFVDEWAKNGVNARCTVYYRDGNATFEVRKPSWETA